MVHLMLLDDTKGVLGGIGIAGTETELVHDAGAGANGNLSVFVYRHPVCCSAFLAWTGHFCRSLIVTHEFRLCLHPGGMLRVQSLHLPLWGLGSALSANAIIENIFPVVNKILPPGRKAAHDKPPGRSGGKGMTDSMTRGWSLLLCE